MEPTLQDKNIKRYSLISTLSLFFQSGFSAVLGLITNLILTVQLSAAIFGVYFLVQSAINLLNYVSDIGLAASLVQKKEITDDDLKTTFTVQQLLIITAITIGYLLTPFVVWFFEFPADASYLYWVLLISFFISSLKTIPSVLLERKIQFQKIVFVQIVENVVFYSVVSTAALMGLGLRSLTIGVLSRAIVGLITMYSISFWMPRIGISRRSLKTLLAFGLPFQASSFLALFKDDLINFYLGKVLGLEAMGYIGWAKKWAEAPIRIIMDNISKVMFPTFSRLQHDTERIGRLIEKITYFQTLLLAPILLGMALLMPNLVYLIPKYSKWAPAIPLFYLFVLSAFFSTYSTPFINLFNALGKIRISFNLMIYWTVATWILTPTLTFFYGMYGFPLTLVFLSLAFIYIIQRAKQLIPFNINTIAPPITAAVCMGVIMFISNQLLPLTWLSSIITGALGGIVYLGILVFIYNIDPIKQVKTLFSYE